MGADFARAALAAGHSVVATGRNSDAVSKALGQSNDLLAVKLDVTTRGDAEAGGRAAVDRFGRIDVLVNNAASFYAGYFEELTPAQIDRQLAASRIGPMNVTRAGLPVMRKQRSGHIISISSSAGLAAGFEFVSAYAASKFGLEGWMESLQAEVAPFGIATTIVNPGFFRTELLTEQSTNYAEASIADYDERREPLVEYWKGQNGQQSGDPAKLARNRNERARELRRVPGLLSVLAFPVLDQWFSPLVVVRDGRLRIVRRLLREEFRAKESRIHDRRGDAERRDLRLQGFHPALETELRRGVGAHEFEAGGETGGR